MMKKSSLVLWTLLCLSLLLPWFDNGTYGYTYLNQVAFFSVPFVIGLSFFIFENELRLSPSLDVLFKKVRAINALVFVFSYGYLALLKGDLEVMVSSYLPFSELALKNSFFFVRLGFIVSFLLALSLAFEAIKPLVGANKSPQLLPNVSYQRLMGLHFCLYFYTLLLPMYDGRGIVPAWPSLLALFYAFPFLPLLLIGFPFLYYKESKTPQKNYVYLYFVMYLSLTLGLMASGLMIYRDNQGHFDWSLLNEASLSEVFEAKRPGFYLSLCLSSLGTFLALYFWLVSAFKKGEKTKSE